MRSLTSALLPYDEEKTSILDPDSVIEGWYSRLNHYGLLNASIGN